MTSLNPSAEKVIDQLRRALDEANWKVALATASAETAAERAAEAENRLAELEGADTPNREAAHSRPHSFPAPASACTPPARSGTSTTSTTRSA